ncbi:hypothetical protein SAMN02910289_00159 [Lachnospiraceae bacterium RM5]|nr:hypothetical protein SAMN02910289_00159 [Lachnospiraceae bacterium RM5]
MLNLSKKIVKYKIPIFIIGLLLLIPAVIIFLNTRINYDILSYLPSSIDTMKGQKILTDEFGTGGFSICIVDGMDEKKVVELEKKIKDIKHVNKVLWYDSLADLSVPMDVLPSEVKDAFINSDVDSTIFIVTFDTASSDDETLEAIRNIDKVTKGEVIQSGMSAVIADIKTICNTEAVIYVVIAVILSIIILSLTVDSFLAPIFFLLSIGMAIVYNMGSNVINMEMSFLTEALAAVLQLAVTMDYSIFLWHTYEEYKEKYPDDNDRAMAHAISNTLVSVVGSSITTVAGFISMCFMTFTFGLDIGIIMAKGVMIGVLCCVTVLPSMLLIFDKAITKTNHKPIIPEINKLGKFITKYNKVLIAIFVLIMIPALYGYTHTEVYYDLVGTLPDNYQSVSGRRTLLEDYDMGVQHMVLCSSDMSSADTSMMIDELNDVEGVKLAVGMDSLKGSLVPSEMIPDSIKTEFDNGKYKLILIQSQYENASDEVNEQIDKLSVIVKKYDKNAMLIGEAPCTKDLINITDKDFKIVSFVSILLVFLIIAVVLKSISLPFILVFVIELGIFINMGIPAFTGTKLPFIASVVIGTIQLGATVDYAILMTNKYKKARSLGEQKRDAIVSAVNGSVPSVMVSALSFFAATIGVGIYSSIDMISSLCILLARGAIISFVMVVFLLPAMFMLLDGVIIRTSKGFLPKEN